MAGSDKNALAYYPNALTNRFIVQAPDFPGLKELRTKIKSDASQQYDYVI